MRIRKYARLGSSVLPKNLQPLTCQLNQSPWDVIPFGLDEIQFGYREEDNFATNVNGNIGNFAGVSKSVASPLDVKQKSPPNTQNVVIHNNDDVNEKNGIALDHKVKKNKTTSCSQCKNNEANIQGQPICEHNNSSLMRSKKADTFTKAHYTRARTAKKALSKASNPYEFYYYSGFGPLWGKRKGDRNRGLNYKNEVKAKQEKDLTITEVGGSTIQSNSLCLSSPIYTEEFDQSDDDKQEAVEDYDKVEEGNGESGKKRIRKPVKERSLKSLM